MTWLPGESKVCTDRCVSSPLAIVQSSNVNLLVRSLTLWIYFLLALAALVVLTRRFKNASARQRHVMWLPFGLAAITCVTGAVYLFLGARFDVAAARGISYFAAWLAVAAVPVAFLVGLLRERLAFAGVADLVGELGRVGPDQVQPGLARVLGDPGLRVLFPVDDHGGYVDVDGRPARVEVDDPARVVTPLGDRSAPLGVLVHDPALLEHRELLDAAGAAARLALENARLQAEVRAQLAEVRASRARLVDVADAERRRLERDLHDGAQQRLLGMGMTLQTLRGRLPVVDAGTDRLFQEATGELRSALRELRDLAQGIHPAVLTDQGLTAALGLLARRCPLPVTVQGELSDRPAAAVEAAAYYLASEALQNTVKHAHAGRATIGVHRDGDALVLDLVDDGVGGADLDGGTGLRGLHDRVTAINGTLTVHSPPGGGTHLSARLPWT
jgi:signal transduction histidine kinase